jgi:hypothetical protein
MRPEVRLDEDHAGWKGLCGDVERERERHGADEQDEETIHAGPGIVLPQDAVMARMQVAHFCSMCGPKIPQDVRGYAATLNDKE